MMYLRIMMDDRPRTPPPSVVIQSVERTLFLQGVTKQERAAGEAAVYLPSYEEVSKLKVQV
jgi:hypothetical protein